MFIFRRDTMEREINVKLKDYKGLKEDFTQVANSMQDYIEDPYTFSVYFYLCRTYNREYGYSFPSIKTIAKKTHISEWKVKKSLAWLIERKFIIKKQLKNGEEFMNNTYIIRYIDMKDIIEEIIKNEEDSYVKIKVDTNDIIEEKCESDSESQL